MDYQIWKRNTNLISGQEYVTNQLVAREASTKGFDAIIDEYVYINSDDFGIILKVFSTFSELIYTYSSIIAEKPFDDASFATN